MRKLVWSIAGLFVVFIMGFGSSHVSYAQEESRIGDHIYIEDMNVSGLTYEEAYDLVAEYIAECAQSGITVFGYNGMNITKSAEELGIEWTNQEIVEDAMELGQKGNIIQRFKENADLKRTPKVYDITFGFDRDAITDWLEEEGSTLEIEKVDNFLELVNGTFVVHEGNTGLIFDQTKTESIVYSDLVNGFTGEPVFIDGVIIEDLPLGTVEELSMVQDVLGTFETNFAGGAAGRIQNIENGVRLFNGTTLYPGEEFSANEAFGVFDASNGYAKGSSYENGKVVESYGGGVCQVTSTLYNALLAAELEISERWNHSMVVSYVERAKDAAVAGSYKDLKFINDTDYPIYLQGYTTADYRVGFTIYGVETRASNRQVAYVSEVYETIPPVGETITQTLEQPIGFLELSSAYTGYKSRLWKVVTVDGVEVERSLVNNSTYITVPRSLVVGVATSNGDAYNQIQAAIATGSIDQVVAVANYWAAIEAAAMLEAAQNAAAQGVVTP